MGLFNNWYFLYSLFQFLIITIFFLDVATDRMVKSMKQEAGFEKEYSVQQLISCSGLRNGCDGATVETAWNIMDLKQNKNGG